ncbi:MAG: CDP-diacylglycerol--glycerol-3-phosphate 3-phosphatidyltransferase [Spirochaetales bacterium]|jgi:CDP-diacylglycerol--glycerol-3-phosphate 3-phosphatidyltransferase|nr:CDP-diacylglycerol--glycerol-3-phosphate 3-phosphatidyltransferase [Spirochaetales bacterium]
MNLPTIVTSFRIILSPLFFLAFFFPVWTGSGVFPSIVILWFIYWVIEISDMVDGSVARALNQVTDTGKLLDPFADVIARLTYFVCFVASGVMPAWTFVPILYRELGVTYLRMIMYKDGFALAANRGGKLKAIFYAIAGGFGLIIHTCGGLGLVPEFHAALRLTGKIIFALAALLSLVSFLDYILVFQKHRKTLRQ